MVQLTLAVYVFAFLIGTSTHIIAIVRGWWLPHHPIVNAYWGSLTVLDPLAIILLIRSPQRGLVLSAMIMVSDVAMNSFASLMYFHPGEEYAASYALQLQTAFLGFVLGSAPFLWAHFDARTPGD